jgi:cyclopropane fatty-acyl-phospholipid synthase-like methyltransferase
VSTADSFDSAYVETPAWDIGRPQPAIVRLADDGEIAGRVLDVGCGTGEHVLFLADRGLEAVGIDGAPRAIQKAVAKAAARGIEAHFEVVDALDIPRRLGLFDTVIDSGLFHVFSDEERPRFRASLAAVLRPGGTYLMMCFSDREPGGWGPRRITQSEIRSSFVDGWQLNYIQAAAFTTTMGTADAWLASFRRL